MWRMLVVSVLLVACSKPRESYEERMPGFTVRLPTGSTRTVSEANSYQAGDARFELVAQGAEFRVEWRYLDRADSAPATYIGNNYSRAFCDSREVILATFGKDTEELHDAFVESFRCMPQVGALDRPPIEILDLRLDGFKRKPKPRKALPSVVYASADLTVIVVTAPETSPKPRFDVKAEVQNVAKQLSATDLRLSPIEGTDIDGTTDYDATFDATRA